MLIDPGALLGPLWTLLAFVGLGWLAARRLSVDPRPIATLLIYIVAPVTFFRGLILGGPTPQYLLLTLAFFLLASTIATVVNPVAKRFLSPQESAVLAFSSGTGNTGYFGLPIAMLMAVIPGRAGLILAVTTTAVACAVNLGTPFGWNMALEVAHAEILMLPFLLLLQAGRRTSATLDRMVAADHRDTVRLARMQTLGEMETRFLG